MANGYKVITLIGSRNGENLLLNGIYGHTGSIHASTATGESIKFPLDADGRYCATVELYQRRGLHIKVYDGDECILDCPSSTKELKVKIPIEETRTRARGLAEQELLRTNGRVFRDGDHTVVEIMGNKGYLLNQEGVTCLNPDAPEEDRIYRRRFIRKKIYLPHEKEIAFEANLRSPRGNVFVLAMNGYSELTPTQCREYGVRPGDYEHACSVLLETITGHLIKQFPGIDIRYAHGSSDMGVDRIIQNVAAKLFKHELGFSCPAYLFYVTDDDRRVYCAESVDAYSRAFVESCHALIAANGRLQAFRMDIAGVFEMDKHLIPVNVLRLISSTGGPPARNGAGKIEDAVAHYEQRVHMLGRTTMTTSGDVWANLVHEACDVATRIGRESMPPSIAWTITK